MRYPDRRARSPGGMGGAPDDVAADPSVDVAAESAFVESEFTVEVTQTRPFIMYRIRVSWVASARGTSPVSRPALSV